MITKPLFALQLLLILLLGLLMLSLFDSNPWWKVVLFSLPTSLLTAYLGAFLGQRDLYRGLGAAAQGLAAALTALVLGLTPFFRTTLGTLLGFALLVALGELLLPQRSGK